MLSNIGSFHPQIVHFVIALLFVGVIFRFVSFSGKLTFTGPAATTLILIGTVAAWLAVFTGEKAHGPVERIPGAHDAVEEHEEWGERARNIFTIVVLLEIAALIAGKRDRRRVVKGLMVASAIFGAAGAFAVYEAGEHGGAIVYDYGGGPGLRSDDPAHIEQLLVAGLYNQAVLAVREKRRAEAVRWIAELERLRPNDRSVTRLRAKADSLTQ